MASTSSQGSSEDPPALVEDILWEWRFSSPSERLYLAFYFRCYYDLIEGRLNLRSRLIEDAKNYYSDYAGNDSVDRVMLNFCQAILWNHQGLRIERPIMHIIARGGPEVLNIVLSQLSSMMPLECLNIMQQFPNYRRKAKINPLLRSLMMRHAHYSGNVGDTDLNRFSVQLLQEFKDYDMQLEPNLLLEELRDLRTEDLLMDIACNEYHLFLVSSCRFTSQRVMRCFSEIFPNLNALHDLLCLQLRIDRSDQ